MRRREWLLALPALGSCGYHIGGKASLLSPQVKSIAVLPFSNITTRYKISDRLAAAIALEFIHRTRYAVVADAEQADAVLRGAVINYVGFPSIFDPTSGRAAGVQLSVMLQISLTERATGKVVYNRPNFEIRERYEVSTDQAQYFEESDASMERLARDVARTVVSQVLNAF
jgi:hypothetical protein